MAALTTAWEIAQALGLCAVAACLALCVLAVRPREGASTAFSRRAHELLGRISNRIINEVRGINRVVYDISSKPPSTIEWE